MIKPSEYTIFTNFDEIELDEIYLVENITFGYGSMAVYKGNDQFKIISSNNESFLYRYNSGLLYTLNSKRRELLRITTKLTKLS